MHRRHVLLLTSLIVSLFILVGTVSAQASLVANVTRQDEHLWSSSSNSYVADLEAGHWTVIVNTQGFWDLQVKIIVATDSIYSNIIAESGTDTGNYPRIAFDLVSNTTVYFRVVENSVYGDTSGFYDVGVYDNAHIPGFFQTLSFVDIMILVSILAGVLPIVCCIVFSWRRSRRGTLTKMRTQSILVDAPEHAIPDYHEGSVQTHGSRTTTVRLPVVCPSCGARVVHEKIDWIGPLEAQCSYCGATIRASLENI
jgi:hypothetical protein